LSIVPSDAGSREAMTGAELALRLLAAFRGLVDELHDRPAAEGHPAARPIHGFALQAIGPQGATAAELGVRLGVSKQAAGKTIDGLEARGYVTRSADRVDARRKLIAITPPLRQGIRSQPELCAPTAPPSTPRQDCQDRILAASRGHHHPS